MTVANNTGHLHTSSLRTLFLPKVAGKNQLNHIDGNKQNNCVDNLEWSTQSENSQHAIRIGLIASGSGNTQASLTDDVAVWLREVYKPHDKNFGARSLAKKLGINKSTVLSIVHGERYKNAGGITHPFDHSHGKKIRLKKKRTSLLTDDQKTYIRQSHIPYDKQFGIRALARKFNVSRTVITRIVTDK